MTERQKIIFSAIPKADVFADVGCDHGYIAKSMIVNNKCNKVIVSDVSAKCLSKAENLLKEEIALGKCLAFVTDGLKGLPIADTVLIAGMGGQEIISILSSAPYKPKNLVLQPMKNTPLCRKFVVNNGYKIVKDYVFFSSGVFYDLLILEQGIDSLTDQEVEFGRTNLIDKPNDFIKKLKWEIDKIEGYIGSGKLSIKDQEIMKSKLEKLNSYV